LAEDKIEEETYSLIYTSLKHPIRRRILRMISQKSFTFSEILEILKIDSGHLSYHLESLGDLTTHTKDGKYILSSFGVAAMNLMGGVEQNYPSPPSANHKHRISQAIPKIFSFILVISLIAASIHLVTYTTSMSTATLNQDRIYPTPFVIEAGQTFEFNITLEYWRYYQPYDDSITMTPIGNLVFSRALYAGPYGPEAYTFEVQPLSNTVTSQAKGSLWLDFRLNTTSRTTGALVLMPYGFPNELEVDVYTPTGNKSLGKLDWTYGKIDHFTSPIVKVNQLGTYQFVIKNNDSNEWTGVLRPYIEWQIKDNPYFLFGLIGLAISIGYIIIISSIFLKTRNDKKNNQSFLTKD